MHMLIHKGALIIHHPKQIFFHIELRKDKSKAKNNRGAIMLMCGHLRLFCIKEIMLEQAEGKQLLLSLAPANYVITLET